MDKLLKYETIFRVQFRANQAESDKQLYKAISFKHIAVSSLFDTFIPFI